MSIYIFYYYTTISGKNTLFGFILLKTQWEICLFWQPFKYFIFLLYCQSFNLFCLSVVFVLSCWCCGPLPVLLFCSTPNWKSQFMIVNLLLLVEAADRLKSLSTPFGCEGFTMPLWSRFGPQIDTSCAANPSDETQKQGERMGTFCLDKMKPRRLCGYRTEAAVNNNISPFMIRCQIGKEIKHICSNCRGAEPVDGEEKYRF